MADRHRSTTKPRLKHALRMRCCLCGETPLLAEGKYLTFRKGCPTCDYAYDRHEDGYFQGAAWMVNYGILSILLMVAGGLLLRFTLLPSMAVVLILSTVALAGGLAIHPLCRSLWMWFDHTLHPLDNEEKLE